MNEARVINKYPNRRLYDTEESRYIKLSDVRDLVLDDVDFVVIDKKSGADITRTILLQVISEQEQQDEAIMSRAFLSDIIRACDAVLPETAAGYLEQCLGVYIQQHSGARSQPPRAADPVMNFNRWKALQGEGSRRPSRGSQPDGDSDDESLPEDCKKAG
jgi:polyhydroxyalkanoate synthesis repressor PhaR